MAQSEQIGLVDLLRNALNYCRNYSIFLLSCIVLGLIITWFLSAGFEEKYAARGVFIATDSDLKADFIYFRTLGDQLKEGENSELNALFANELILDDGTRAIDITLHLTSQSSSVIEDLRQETISRSLKEVVPFTLSNRPILLKNNILIFGGLFSLMIGLLFSIFHKAWIDSRPNVVK